MSRSIPTPGAGRITLALLVVVPAAMAYPWRSPRDYWLLGIAAAVVVVLFGWWHGLHFTTILRRRLAMVGRGRNQKAGLVPESGCATKTTALLRVGPPVGDSDVLPLPVIAGYLDRYGVRADKIRITSRDNASDPSRRETWIGITVSAPDNLAALRARSSRIPLHETAQVVARRLADHLREIGWEASAVGPADVPRPLEPDARESWRGVQRGASDYIAAYQVRVDDGLPETLDAIRSHPAHETCTALEISGEGTHRTVAAACAIQTDTPPGGAAPLDGLTPQRGNHRPALAALDPLSTRRLDGHTGEPAGLLARLVWPTPVAGAHRASPAEPVRT
ncbi:type VII secretion protein EccE [Mycobacterium heidelbergense]|uniref:Type VII secretion protein EccE n=1 Tax=Mycobacterium heidelbergense TaxID=53376 RepID=A0A1X0DDD6_MYCHE|nr:type VII secretion protein EccE [Mycobacterium heidelbergense]MCV7051424.1 type VII secretion protein EccE [Mycobacterium heidelbergense]ORA70411.1 type VII secretion protein EccE [Mycobacterium heidelbergense]BBZ49864.1 type VII secretion protein EccE [Mycobacterium heidelbergense]